MALKLLHTSGTPLGEYDALDTDLTAGFLGGEVVTFTSTLLNSGDKSAADSADGYVNPTGSGAVNRRVVLSKTAGAPAGPFMLVDDGLSGYGVLFGVVTGGAVGQTSFSPTGGTPIGPASYVGSGKLTVWATPGLFGVTLDACDTTASTGLQPTNATLAPGAKLFVMTGGLLTPNSSASGASASAWAARFVDFETNRSLVTTPNRLVAALNSPSSTVTGTLPQQLTMAVVSFGPMQ